MKTFIPLILFFFSTILAAQTPISEVKDYVNSNTPTSENGLQAFYGVEYTVSGLVTSGPELGAVRYIQDETGAIAIYGGGTLSNVVPGDIVTVTGELIEFAGLAEISGITDETFELVSSGNELPEPLEITADDFVEANESQYVRLSDVSFQDIGNFSGNSNYTVTDANGATIAVRIDDDSPIVGTSIPSGTVSIIGNLGQFQETYQLLPRTLADFGFQGAPGLASAIRAEDFDQNSITIAYESQVPGETTISYGLTEALELGSVDGGVLTAEHEIMIDGLEAGEIYYFQINSTSESGETYTSNVFPLGTVSESTGDIDVFFNAPVNNSISNGTDAVYDESLHETIISYIDAAETSLDVMIYSFDNGLGIVTAINDAYDRGVTCRFITGSDEAGTESFNIVDIGSGNKVARPSGLQGLMHNKVIIIDADSEDPNKPTVISGSTNFSAGQIGEDPNEIIVIQDQTLAKAYTLEMDEMMSGAFGENKVHNTPNNFKIGGSDVELYFSPTDDIETAMEGVIDSADDELYFAIFSFTRNNIAYAISDAFSAGVCVAGVTDNITEDTPFMVLDEELVQTGLLIEDGGGPIMHHKYMIVDPNSSDPTVITGSPNWTNNGFFRSDENMLVIHNPTIANIYHQSFAQRYLDYGGDASTDCGAVGVEDITTEAAIKVYPNPVNEKLFFNIDATNSKEVNLQLFDLNGRELLNRSFPAQVGSTLYYTDLPDLASGMYIVKINGIASQLVVK